MIIECRGNLLDDDADVLVCTTNAIGVMGKGVALAFKNKWPSIFEPYKNDCIMGKLYAGSCLLYDLPDNFDLFNPKIDRKWAAFCTKGHWKNPSEYRWIKEGLVQLYDLLVIGEYKTVAIPPLGCGLGGLEFYKVYPMIKEWFENSHIEARVYLP